MVWMHISYKRFWSWKALETHDATSFTHVCWLCADYMHENGKILTELDKKHTNKKLLSHIQQPPPNIIRYACNIMQSTVSMETPAMYA